MTITAFSWKTLQQHVLGHHHLFHATAVRFAAAMAGADYGVFTGGRWQLAKRLREMEEKLRLSERGR